MRCGLSILLIALCTSSSFAQALKKPPVLPRQWVTTCTNVAQTITVEQRDATKIVTGPTKAIAFTNDGAAGTPDIWVGMAGTVAAAPVDGGSVITVKAGETRSFDIELTQISVISSGANNTLRTLASY